MSVEERLERVEQMLTTLVEQQTIKDWYTTQEVGGILGRAEYTAREWCRQGRIRAKKKPCGRGKGGEWLISHEERTRLKNEGFSPSGPRHDGETGATRPLPSTEGVFCRNRQVDE
jgi:hypothetical protein